MTLLAFTLAAMGVLAPQRDHSVSAARIVRGAFALAVFTIAIAGLLIADAVKAARS